MQCKLRVSIALNAGTSLQEPARSGMEVVMQLDLEILSAKCEKTVKSFGCDIRWKVEYRPKPGLMICQRG